MTHNSRSVPSWGRFIASDIGPTLETRLRPLGYNSTHAGICVAPGFKGPAGSEDASRWV